HPALTSFPTRRSSDLRERRDQRTERRRRKSPSGPSRFWSSRGPIRSRRATSRGIRVSGRSEAKTARVAGGSLVRLNSWGHHGGRSEERRVGEGGRWRG